MQKEIKALAAAIRKIETDKLKTRLSVKPKKGAAKKAAAAPAKATGKKKV